MGLNRGTLILIGAGLLAFLAFLVFGWAGGGDDDRAGPRIEATDNSEAPGSAAGGDASGGGGAGGLLDADKSPFKKKRAGGEKKIDPELAEKIEVPDDLLVAASAPESPKEGIVRQTFTGVVAGGARGTRAGGSARSPENPDAGGDDEPAPDEDSTNNCPECGAPTVRSMVIDVKAQPLLGGAFEATCGSPFIDQGLGERFEIDDDPACVMYVPETCRGSGAALLSGRFFVSLQGECIPNREFLKQVLAR